MFSDQAWREVARRLRLSGQELRIVRGVFNGHKEYAIAANLGISPHTVHTHFERLHRKLGVADRVELVLRVIEEFLLVMASPTMLYHAATPAAQPGGAQCGLGESKKTTSGGTHDPRLSRRIPGV